MKRNISRHSMYFDSSLDRQVLKNGFTSYCTQTSVIVLRPQLLLLSAEVNPSSFFFFLYLFIGMTMR